jgi:3-phosphoshikimate 1-carboxyvinyltransferase
MEDHGVRFSSRTLPFRLSGKLESGRYALPGNVSSQYISGLLLALPLLEGDSELVLTTELESAGYVDMTIDCQKQFGICLEPLAQAAQQHPSGAGAAGCGWRIPGGQAYRAPAALDVEGDWSSAAFWLVASALGSSVDITGLSPSSLQRDRQLVSIIEQNETDIDVRDIPDLVPILAVLAAGRRDPKNVKTVLRNGSRLRLKESDRIESVLEMIRALGGTIENPGDELIVTGTGTLAGGTVHSAGDHRIAMAAAIAATVCAGPVTILDAHVASKSYPDFFAHYESLGGETHVL